MPTRINLANVTNPRVLMTILEEIVTMLAEIKADMSAHTHTVTHAACSAVDAAYGAATPVTSAAGNTIASSPPDKGV